MEIYPYLEEVIQDSSRRKVVIAGRRVGKTEAIVEDAARRLTTAGPDHLGLIVSPSQIISDCTFERLLNRIPSEEIQNIRPGTVDLKNGAQIRAVSYTDDSERMRGMWATHVWVEDPDYMREPEAAVLSFLVCAASAPGDPYVLIAGTPSERTLKQGEKEERRPSVFRSIYLRAFKRFWLPSWLNPNWDRATEDYLRRTTGPKEFAQEFLGAA